MFHRMDLLVRIKRAVINGRIFFTQKATEERKRDDLTEEEVREAIINAPGIFKSIRSMSPLRRKRKEMLHVIYGTTFTGIVIYTKGKLVVEGGIETYYVCVSAKRSE